MLSAANPIDNFIHKTAQPSPGRSTSSCARFSRPGWTCRPAGRPGRPWTWRYRFLSRPGKRFRATRWQVCVWVYLIGLKSNRIKHLDGKTLTGLRGGGKRSGRRKFRKSDYQWVLTSMYVYVTVPTIKSWPTSFEAWESVCHAVGYYVEWNQMIYFRCCVVMQ